jgi:hypothetical protein
MRLQSQLFTLCYNGLGWPTATCPGARYRRGGGSTVMRPKVWPREIGLLGDHARFAQDPAATIAADELVRHQRPDNTTLAMSPK